MKMQCVNAKKIHNDILRLDSKYHLSAGTIALKSIVLSPYKLRELSQLTENIYNGARFRRCYVYNSKYGIPFMGSSNMLRNRFDLLKKISSKYTRNLSSLLLQKDWILISCSGTIGNTVYTNDDYAGKAASQHIIRVVPNNEIFSGYLFAFLSSRYGYDLLTKGTYGAVIQHIEPEHIEDIPVPILPNDEQKEIHNLIIEASDLRVKANKLLEEATRKLNNLIDLNYRESLGLTIGTVKLCNIKESLQSRLDAPVFINNAVKQINSIIDNREFCKLHECDVNVSRPAIFKRSYVKDGLPYIKGSELFNINPFIRCEHLSKNKTPFLAELKLHDEQILMTCAGSCGNVKLITKEYEDKNAIGSQDIIRIESNDNLFTLEYLFVYLNTKLVFDYIQSMKYGSVIERIEPLHVRSIPIIKPSKELSSEITNLIKCYKNNMYIAFTKENQAIKLVETEIESWQQ